jgi:membrane protease YdiL (CAAX protease family)
MTNENQGVSRIKREPSPHDRSALYQISLVITALILSIAYSIYSGKSVFVMGYIVAIVYMFHGPIHHHRPWQEVGLKRGFLSDFRRIWYFFATGALLFQIVPPTFLLAIAFGYWSELLHHITARVSDVLGSLQGVSAIGMALGVALILTLIEELVFRVTIQERLSWFIGAPAAISITSALFGLVHSIGTLGSPLVILVDVVGVALDGVFFGIIYSKTHNLALTWTTHYIADVVGIIALVLVY